MTIGSLFAGIGGFELAATWAGIEPVWSNEIDSFCCKVLRKNFNHEIIEKDIREIGKHNLKRVDIISGGFPCQPFSQAGKRKGQADNRYLWPEMLRVIKELQPSYVIGENVAGLLSMENGETLKGMLTDLEDQGYHNEIFIIPACATGAWHRRDRIWIIAYTDSNGRREFQRQNKILQNQNGNDTSKVKGRQRFPYGKIINDMQTITNPKTKRLQKIHKKHGISQKKTKRFTMQDSTFRQQYREIEPGMDRVVNGIPNRMDRIKGLGNAIDPYLAFELFKAILTPNKQQPI